MAVPNRPSAGAPIESAWGGLAHDTAVAQDIQSGTAVCPATGSGIDNSSIAVVFPRPFAAPPIVVCTSQTGNFITAASAVTATGFTLNNANKTTAGSLGARTNFWVAIGPRA
jgi:hypothetical protein